MRIMIDSAAIVQVEQSRTNEKDCGSSPTLPLHFFISPIGYMESRLWIEKWHYSKKMPTGKNICFGLFYGNNLYAVIVYGIGVNPYQAKFLGANRVIEIKRMARSEPKLPYSLSRFISLTSKMAWKQFPFDCIVAFADPEHYHSGTVYKASGFKLHGETNSEWHLIDKNGVIRHRRFAYRMAKRKKISLMEARKILDVKRIKTLPKYRWIRWWGRYEKNSS